MRSAARVLTGILFGLVTLISASSIQAQALPPYCDGFESAGALTSWSIIDGEAEVVSSPTHSGGSALMLWTESGDCEAIIRTNLCTSPLGEYSVWVRQDNASPWGGGTAFYFQLQPTNNPDTHFWRCYRFGSDAGSYGSLLQIVKHSGDGTSQSLGAIRPVQYSIGDWVRIFVRQVSPGAFEFGYELNGNTVTAQCTDPNPIIEPGAFALSSCSAIGEPRNYFDDVCFDGTLIDCPPTEDTCDTILVENFSTNVFAGGNWTRSDASVAVDQLNGWLRIGSDGASNGFAEKYGPFPLPLVVEWRERTFSGEGAYISLPKLEFWFGPSSSNSYHISYVQDDQSGSPVDDGWIFGSWTNVDTVGPASWNQWRTVKAVLRSDGGELFAKQDSDPDFTPIATHTWAIGNVIERFRLSQHSDDVSDFDFVRITDGACNTGTEWCDEFEDGPNFLDRWIADRCCAEPTSSITHSGAGAVSLGGTTDQCLAWLRRKSFQALAGEYSGWYYQTSPIAGGNLYFAVQNDPDIHPQYSPGYGISLNAGGSDNPTFWLIKPKNTWDGDYDILGTVQPQFVLNQWVRIVGRYLDDGTIVAGYDLDDTPPLTDSIVYFDTTPIGMPGQFYISGCAMTGEPKNAWDDVCFNSYVAPSLPCEELEGVLISASVDEIDLSKSSSGEIILSNPSVFDVAYSIGIDYVLNDGMGGWLVINDPLSGVIPAGSDLRLTGVVQDANLRPGVNKAVITVDTDCGRFGILTWAQREGNNDPIILHRTELPFSFQGHLEPGYGSDFVTDGGVRMTVDAQRIAGEPGSFHVTLEFATGDDWFTDIGGFLCPPPVHHMPRAIVARNWSRLNVLYDAEKATISNERVIDSDGRTILDDYIEGSLSLVLFAANFQYFTDLGPEVSELLGLLWKPFFENALAGYGKFVFSELHELNAIRSGESPGENWTYDPTNSLEFDHIYDGMNSSMTLTLGVDKDGNYYTSLEGVALEFDVSFDNPSAGNLTIVPDFVGEEQNECIDFLSLFDFRKQVRVQLGGRGGWLTGVSHSPINLRIQDEAGNVVDKWNSDIEASRFVVRDIDGDGHEEEVLIIDRDEKGIYRFYALPLPNMAGDSTFSIEVRSERGVEWLCRNIPVAEIDTNGYTFSTLDTGSVFGVVSLPEGTGLHGTPVDLYDDQSSLVASAATDENGHYGFYGIHNGEYVVSIATPVGYQPDQEIKEVVVRGLPHEVNFDLTRLDATARQRTRAYWSQQLSKALRPSPPTIGDRDFDLAKGGFGFNETISRADFARYAGLISQHFNGNRLGPIDEYTVPQPATQMDSLNALLDLLNLKPKAAGEHMLKRLARGDLVALMLNVVSGRLHQADSISRDGNTASQAITYGDMLINDPSCPVGDIPNTYMPWYDRCCELKTYIKACFILGLINVGVPLPAGAIPDEVLNIAFKEDGGQAPLPTEAALLQNYPNPFNAGTTISYTVASESHVTLAIYNLLGQKVVDLVDADQNQGAYSVEWDGRDARGEEVASGLYLYRLQVGDLVMSKKMTLLR